MEDVGGTNRKQAPHSHPELEDITVTQRFFYVCFSIRVPTKQTKWTLKFQLIEGFWCWDEKGTVLHVLYSKNNETLKVATECSSSKSHRVQKNWGFHGIWFCKLRSVNFIQYYCTVQTCWRLQRTEAASCHMGHLHLTELSTNKTFYLGWQCPTVSS
jgi:hypothetical protein